jgi:hypothetical protein
MLLVEWAERNETARFFQKPGQEQVSFRFAMRSQLPSVLPRSSAWRRMSPTHLRQRIPCRRSAGSSLGTAMRIPVPAE